LVKLAILLRLPSFTTQRHDGEVQTAGLEKTRSGSKWEQLQRRKDGERAAQQAVPDWEWLRKLDSCKGARNEGKLQGELWRMNLERRGEMDRGQVRSVIELVCCGWPNIN